MVLLLRGKNVPSAPWVRRWETERPGVTHAAQLLGSPHGCGIFAQCLKRDSGDRRWTCWQHQEERTCHTVLLRQAPCTRGNEALGVRSISCPCSPLWFCLWRPVWPASGEMPEREPSWDGLAAQDAGDLLGGRGTGRAFHFAYNNRFLRVWAFFPKIF